MSNVPDFLVPMRTTTPKPRLHLMPSARTQVPPVRSVSLATARARPTPEEALHEHGLRSWMLACSTSLATSPEQIPRRYPCSTLHSRRASARDGGSITSVTTRPTTLAKLKKLGAVDRHRQPTTGAHCWSLTERFLRRPGLRLQHGSRSLPQRDRGVQTHPLPDDRPGRSPARVPAGFFRQSLGIEPVGWNSSSAERNASSLFLRSLLGRAGAPTPRKSTPEPRERHPRSDPA